MSKKQLRPMLRLTQFITSGRCKQPVHITWRMGAEKVLTSHKGKEALPSSERQMEMEITLWRGVLCEPRAWEIWRRSSCKVGGSVGAIIGWKRKGAGLVEIWLMPTDPQKSPVCSLIWEQLQTVIDYYISQRRERRILKLSIRMKC